MRTFKLASREAVIATVREFDALGREAFLAKYGFGRARQYFLLWNTRYYDSKAVAGVAFGHEHPNSGPLAPSEFSGGEKTVMSALMDLGFTVIKGAPATDQAAALVLVENEITIDGKHGYLDNTGVLYHFPNQYRNRVQPGTPFVYYRGVRRRGGKRGQTEYFGTGVIGDVWRDPDQPADTAPRHRRWYCEIEHYVPFSNPVAARYGGKTFEAIDQPLGWQPGVRVISESVFHKILSIADVEKPKVGNRDVAAIEAKAAESNASELVLARPKGRRGKAKNINKDSRRAKEIGTWAEEVVYRWLYHRLKPEERDSLDWLARRGETPGWDIGYVDQQGRTRAIEVKATTASRFSAIEVTGNEWRAAELMGPNYALALVTGACSKRPRIALLWDPNAQAITGELIVEPLSFRLTKESA